MAASIPATAVLSDTLGGRLNEMVLATQQSLMIDEAESRPGRNARRRKAGSLSGLEALAGTGWMRRPLPVAPIELVEISGRLGIGRVDRG